MEVAAHSPENPKKNKVPGRKRTQIFINTTNIIDNADGQLFPTLYEQIQSTTGLSIEDLGLVTGIRSLLQSLTTPIWGWWSDKHSRKKVLSIGCFVWGIFTILVGFGFQYYDILLYRAITGIGLAVIVPTTQSLISDYFPPAKRGTAFELLGLTGVLGIVFGTLFATILVTESPYLWGLDSWRVVFIIWGIISIIIGVLVLLFAKDPIRGQMEPELAGTITQEKAEQFKSKGSDIKKILKNRTFALIVLQGVAGSIPWNGIFFIVLWFEYIGFDPVLSGLMFAFIAIGAALGNLFGGWLGDQAAKRSPKRGRIIIAQISVFSGIPLTFLIFLGIPPSTASMDFYVIIGALTGFLISWCAGGTNNPIFSELFEPEIRSTVFSIDRMFEGSFASLGTVIVAAVATLFGYVTPPTGIEVSTLAPAMRSTNMMALGYGMFFTALIPWILCLILYSFVYRTYPKDLQAIQKVLRERGKVLASMS